MTRVFKAIVALTALGAGLALAPNEAEAQRGRYCRETYCAKRAPFVCQGPIGSCGFAQGRCLKTGVRVVACGRPDPVR